MISLLILLDRWDYVYNIKQNYKLNDKYNKHKIK